MNIMKNDIKNLDVKLSLPALHIMSTIYSKSDLNFKKCHISLFNVEEIYFKNNLLVR